MFETFERGFYICLHAFLENLKRVIMLSSVVYDWNTTLQLQFRSQRKYSEYFKTWLCPDGS